MPLWGNKKDIETEQSLSPDDDGFLHPESFLPSNRDLMTSEWSKERSHQQLELENVYNEQLGCCSKVGLYTVEALHAIDVSIGLALLIYGSLLFTRFENPATAAALFCVILGTIHVATSLAGIISFSAGACSRCGLVISAYIAPYYVIVYITIVIALIVDSNGLLTYLDENKDQMFLGENASQNFKRMLPLIYTILIVLGLLESLRFIVLFQIRLRLLRCDETDPLKPRSTKSGPNNTLTEALLESNTAIHGSIDTSIMGEREQQWWDR